MDADVQFALPSGPGRITVQVYPADGGAAIDTLTVDLPEDDEDQIDDVQSQIIDRYDITGASSYGEGADAVTGYYARRV